LNAQQEGGRGKRRPLLLLPPPLVRKEGKGSLKNNYCSTIAFLPQLQVQSIKAASYLPLLYAVELEVE